MIRKFRLPPTYMPLSDNKYHDFQRRMLEFVRDSERGAIAIVHAPTGTGKTRVVSDIVRDIDPSVDPAVLYCTPTNALAQEVKNTLSENSRGKVFRWTAEDFTHHGARRHEEILEQARMGSAIVSNPDILHLFSQHEYISPRRLRYDPERSEWLQKQRIRLFDFAQRNIGIHFFDEYHAYDERILASIILYILKCRNLGLDHRYIFMSATPQTSLLQSLKAIFGEGNIEFIEEHELVGKVPDNNYRMIKGELEVTVRGDSIHNSLPDSIPEKRTLFVFQSFTSQQMAVINLQRKCIPEGDDGFIQITGRETKSERGQMDWDAAPILLATSKVDLGLNIDNLDRLVMEPGWSEQQFWQRFGRAGRGRPAEVVLHFEGVPEEILNGIKGPGYKELQQQIAGILRPRHLNAESILRFVGYYAAAFEKNTKESAVRESVSRSNLPVISNTSKVLLWSIMGDIDKSDNLAEAKLYWQSIVMDSLCGLRGFGLPVRVRYSWRGEDVVIDDLLWVISRTEPPLNNEDDIHVIESIRDTPIDADLTYPGLPIYGSNIRIKAKKGVLPWDAMKQLSDRLEYQLEQIMEPNDDRFWHALIAWLKMVPRDQIPPLEVSEDDIFL